MGGSMSRVDSGGYDPSPLPAPHLREPGEAEEPVGDVCVRIQPKDPKTREPSGPATTTCYDHDGREIEEADILAEANRGEGIPSFNNMLHAKSAAEVDRLLVGVGPTEMERLLSDPDLDARSKSKLVEVALIRGGSDSADELRGSSHALKWRGDSQNDPNQQARTNKILYQRAAVEAIMGSGGGPPADGGAVLEALSRSPGSIDGRQAATHFMHVLAQRGGFRTADEIGAWMNGLPAEQRGRAYFHLVDASDKGETSGARVGAVLLQLGPIGTEFHFRDKHWKATAETVSNNVINTIKQRRQDGGVDEAQAFKDGIRGASLSVDSL